MKIKLPNIFKKEKEYYSCKQVRRGFNFYRSNKISSCCYTTENELIIGNIEDYSNLDDITDDIINFQKNLIQKHKKGNAPKCCRECTNFKKAKWSDDVDKKFDWISLNHYKICNLKCTHCSYRKTDDNEKDSNHELIVKVVDAFSRKNMLKKDVVLAIGGGEPSINKGIDLILQYCLDNKYKALINSNGAKFSELIAKGVNEGLFKLDLTPDAGSKEVYAKIKGVDCFELTWGNIKKYIDSTDKKANVKFIIEEGNVDDVENMIDMCFQNGINHVTLAFDINIEKQDFDKYSEPVNKFIRLCKENDIKCTVSRFVPREILNEN